MEPLRKRFFPFGIKQLDGSERDKGGKNSCDLKIHARLVWNNAVHVHGAWTIPGNVDSCGRICTNGIRNKLSANFGIIAENCIFAMLDGTASIP